MRYNKSCLFFISIGLRDEKDMSIKALETARQCDKLYAEFYTTKLDTTIEKLQNLIGKKIKLLNRKELEENYQKQILDEAKTKGIGLLVGGDSFVATTHLALKIDAMKQNIKTKIIHGSSIISAVAETGLHIYKFGSTVTIPFPEKTKGKPPESVFEVIRENKKRELHTLCLLDVIAEENKYMNTKEGLQILLQGEVVNKDDKVVVFAKGGSENPLIVYDTVNNLIKNHIMDIPAVIIIPGKLHFTEKEYLESIKL